jgi:hypothetical protein
MRIMTLPPVDENDIEFKDGLGGQKIELIDKQEPKFNKYYK